MTQIPVGCGQLSIYVYIFINTSRARDFTDAAILNHQESFASIATQAFAYIASSLRLRLKCSLLALLYLHARSPPHHHSETALTHSQSLQPMILLQHEICTQISIPACGHMPLLRSSTAFPSPHHQGTYAQCYFHVASSMHINTYTLLRVPYLRRG